MAEEKTYKVGHLIYSLRSDHKAFIESFCGPTGPGSVASAPAEVEIEGNIYSVIGNFGSVLENQAVEKVIVSYDWQHSFCKMPILKSVEIQSIDETQYIGFTDCPSLEEVKIGAKVRNNYYAAPIEIKGDHGRIRIEYQKGISFTNHVISGGDTIVVFGDEAEEAGIIRGGHVILGKGVKEIKAMKKAEFGVVADTTVAEYELPTRIDFLSPEPPTVGAVAPGSMTVAELHVPAGALDAYMNHHQWGKAAYFVEEGGKTVDKYAAKHKARMKKLQKEREEKEVEAADKAKIEKVKAMGGMMHSTLAPQRLAKWNPGAIHDWNSDIHIPIIVGPLSFTVKVPKDAPIDIWDKVVAKIEEMEAKLNEA